MKICKLLSPAQAWLVLSIINISIVILHHGSSHCL